MNFKHCTLFTTALCNLNCSYCYICKDSEGGLHQIDKDIENDFKNKTYIKQLLDYDESLKDSIEGITLWGGEPFLKLERFTEQVEDWFLNFPNINTIMTSTNFTLPDHIDKLEKLLKEISKYYKKTQGKKLKFELQISIDGYEEMNDFGRGEGITKRFLENFYKMLDMSYDTETIDLIVYTKPTLSRETFHFLDSKEKCYKWFKYFEEYLYNPYKDSTATWVFSNSIFNFAQPTEWSKEDGLFVRDLIKNILDITDQVFEECPGWRNCISLNPFLITLATQLDTVGPIFSFEQVAKERRHPTCGGGCGSFVGNIVPITHGKFTMCHRGVFDEYIDYVNNLNNQKTMNGLSEKFFKSSNVEDWVYSKEEMKTSQTMMLPLYTCPNQIIYTDVVTFVREYAFAGIIDEKYKDIKNAELAVDYFLRRSYCVQDAYLQNGSWTTLPTYEFPLLLNGALDLSIEEFNKILTKKGWKID